MSGQNIRQKIFPQNVSSCNTYMYIYLIWCELMLIYLIYKLTHTWLIYLFWTLSDTWGHQTRTQNFKSKNPLATKSLKHLCNQNSWFGGPCFLGMPISLAQKHFLSIRFKCKFTIIQFWGVAFVFEIIQNLSHVFIYSAIQLYWWILCSLPV